MTFVYRCRRAVGAVSRATARAVALALVSLQVLSVGACTSTAPPVQEMSDARLAIAAAEAVDAAKHAPEPFGEARQLLERAERHLERRAFAAARRDADLAKQRATEAREQAEREQSQPKRDQPVPIK